MVNKRKENFPLDTPCRQCRRRSRHSDRQRSSPSDSARRKHRQDQPTRSSPKKSKSMSISSLGFEQTFAAPHSACISDLGLVALCHVTFRREPLPSSSVRTAAATARQDYEMSLSSAALCEMPRRTSTTVGSHLGRQTAPRCCCRLFRRSNMPTAPTTALAAATLRIAALCVRGWSLKK